MPKRKYVKSCSCPGTYWFSLLAAAVSNFTASFQVSLQTHVCGTSGRFHTHTLSWLRDPESRLTGIPVRENCTVRMRLIFNSWSP